jgi:hypothetical protein
MSYKPEEGILMAYLYGELGEDEKRKVETYLLHHPDEQARIRQFQSLRQVMSAAQDQEVIAPPVFVEEQKSTFWQSAYWRMPIGIAAGVLLVLVAARLLQIDISYHQQELRVTFGKPVKVENEKVPSGLTADQVQQMIAESVNQNQEMLTSHWNQRQEKLTQAIQANLADNTKKIDALARMTSDASQDQVKAYVAGLKDENQRVMKEYLTLSATEQKAYMENLLVDFSKYLTEQRNQDLALFQNRILAVESTTNQFKQETEQILTSIITSGRNLNKNKTNAY